jgi:hypothetical protein
VETWHKAAKRASDRLQDNAMKEPSTVREIYRQTCRQPLQKLIRISGLQFYLLLNKFGLACILGFTSTGASSWLCFAKVDLFCFSNKKG